MEKRRTIIMILEGCEAYESGLFLRQKKMRLIERVRTATPNIDVPEESNVQNVRDITVRLETAVCRRCGGRNQ